MDIIAATHSYESWLHRQTPVYRPALDYKHERMADSADPFPFFRATYYRWVQLCKEAAIAAMEGPTVLAIGDLHVENYGTWRDADGRLCWGINDFDEVDHLPYPYDLVRLATSARFARQAGLLAVKTPEACQAILAGYHKALAVGGKAFILEEKHRRLRGLALDADRDPVRFWERLRRGLIEPETEPPEEVKALLARELPAEGLSPEILFRPRAGLGSLGKHRYVALARWNGSWVAREAKPLIPPATVWASGLSRTGALGPRAVAQAVRCPDPSYRLLDNWVVRRLGPNCSKIRPQSLRRAGDPWRLLRAMGAEVANIHLGTPAVADAIRADLAGKPDDWLLQAVRALCRLVQRDWTAWQEAHARAS